MQFSIIIPVYNVERYLPECLNSVMEQTCQDFEVLLIDDGSTDTSGSICDDYARQYPRQITVLHQENSGCNRSRVKGLEQATGEICLFVDSDDALRRDALERIRDAFAENGCDLLLYGASRDADFISRHWDLPFADGQCFAGEAKQELYALMATSGKLNTLCVKAAKKQVYDLFLKDYDTTLDLPYGEDLYLSLPLMTHAKKITYLGENLYFYRMREGSAVHSFHPALHRSLKIVQKELETYLALWGIQDCYPAFYARVVANWSHATKQLLKNQAALTKAERAAIVRELAEDDFFRKAYEQMQPECLCLRDRLLAWLLYRKHFLCLWWIGQGFARMKKH